MSPSSGYRTLAELASKDTSAVDALSWSKHFKYPTTEEVQDVEEYICYINNIED